MPVLIPMGSRVLVEDIDPVDDVTERARQAGLAVVVYDQNKPKPTTGKVIALGPDPEIHRLLKIGDVVFFSRHSGVITSVDGRAYRTLEFHEITNVLREEPTS